MLRNGARNCATLFQRETANPQHSLSLHDALPISDLRAAAAVIRGKRVHPKVRAMVDPLAADRSEEHTSELQSRPHFVCRLLLEKTNAPNDRGITFCRHRYALVRSLTVCSS